MLWSNEEYEKRRQMILSANRHLIMLIIINTMIKSIRDLLVDDKEMETGSHRLASIVFVRIRESWGQHIELLTKLKTSDLESSMAKPQALFE